MATTELESDEWELVNDDGFVYKRQKRRLDPSAIDRSADPAPDPELEPRQRRERKLAALLKVRDKYSKEICLWERIAYVLRAMEHSARDQHVDDRHRAKALGQHRNHPGEEESEAHFLLHELLMQVEGQEAIIHHITNLCDVAEALCDGLEDNGKQTLLDFLVWESPLQLMASLSED